MSGPGFARPDLCSIRAADEQEELALGEAVSGGFSADSSLLAADDPPAPLASGIDPRHPPVHCRGRARRRGSPQADTSETPG